MNIISIILFAFALVLFVVIAVGVQVSQKAINLLLLGIVAVLIVMNSGWINV